MIGYVYKLTDRRNGKVYIGQHHGKKLSSTYRGSGHGLTNEIKNNCDICVKEWCDTQEQLNEAEEYWIKYYDATNPDKGYNMTVRGWYGGNIKFCYHKINPEWLELKKSKKGVKCNDTIGEYIMTESGKIVRKYLDYEYKTWNEIHSI